MRNMERKEMVMKRRGSKKRKRKRKRRKRRQEGGALRFCAGELKVNWHFGNLPLRHVKGGFS